MLEEEKRARSTSVQVGEKQKERPAPDEEEDNSREAKTSNHVRTEKSGAESEAAERGRETVFPAEAKSTKKDAETTRHVPRGTLALQDRVPSKKKDFRVFYHYHTKKEGAEGTQTPWDIMHSD
ncbi:hypothetical protein NDU88_005234 [Pleurodeles waltl]|uniref:Uncharacterized protein n=1 Tax=Pleurodeles waltl TaxID=8319 RepID=A0AAV7QKD5_PLEWA|nr:hypothetical protein NDU88_005234 [Pleurodeles waltl]